MILAQVSLFQPRLNFSYQLFNIFLLFGGFLKGIACIPPTALSLLPYPNLPGSHIKWPPSSFFIIFHSSRFEHPVSDFPRICWSNMLLVPDSHFLFDESQTSLKSF